MRVDFDTWQRGKELVSWTFSLPARGGLDGFENIRARAMEVLSALDGFARLCELCLTTEERGEFAIVVTVQKAEDLAVAQNALGTPERVLQVLMYFDLLVSLEADAADIWLQEAAHLWLNVDEHSAEDGSIGFVLSLDVDIYSPVTWGKSSDNRERAQRNGPRLTNFLRIIREDLGGVCDAVDVQDYAGHVDENGFK